MRPIPPMPTDDPCRLPGCAGIIVKAFKYHKRHDRIGAGPHDPNYARVSDGYYCPVCGIKYRFPKAQPPEAGT